MNSCHEEGIRDRNRAGVEATDPARMRDRYDVKKTNGNGSSQGEGIDATHKKCCPVLFAVPYIYTKPGCSSSLADCLLFSIGFLLVDNSKPMGWTVLPDEVALWAPGVRDQNRAGIEAADPMRSAGSTASSSSSIPVANTLLRPEGMTAACCALEDLRAAEEHWGAFLQHVEDPPITSLIIRVCTYSCRHEDRTAICNCNGIVRVGIIVDSLDDFPSILDMPAGFTLIHQLLVYSEYEHEISSQNTEGDCKKSLTQDSVLLGDFVLLRESSSELSDRCHYARISSFNHRL
eukprot:gene20586-biopygen927